MESVNIFFFKFGRRFTWFTDYEISGSHDEYEDDILVGCSAVYSTQMTSWSPQGMRVLRQCKFSRAEVMFVTIQRENILLSKKEMNKAVYQTKFVQQFWLKRANFCFCFSEKSVTFALLTPFLLLLVKNKYVGRQLYIYAGGLIITGKK
jgi:hypothetical protein